MEPGTILLLEIIKTALEKGVPAVLKIISSWQITGDDITQEDIQALSGKLKDPASFFED